MEYQSNCFIEALRAKIKSPKRVKLHVGWEPCTRQKFWSIHAWWTIGQVEYDFRPTVPITWLNYWWHKGQIRSYGKVLEKGEPK